MTKPSSTSLNHPKQKTNMWIQRGIVIALALIAIVCYFTIPAFQGFCAAVVSMFASGDFSVAREFIASYGAEAALVSFVLMVAQSIIAPLPAFVITITNANLFGWWQGALLSWTSSMVGACLCFWIARILGREAVEKLTSVSAIEKLDVFFEKYGTKSVLIARLLPFVSFDFVSYFAGLTGMSFRSFIIATGIGQLPATIVYSYVGGMLTGGAQMLMTGLLILFALGIAIAIARQIFVERKK